MSSQRESGRSFEIVIPPYWSRRRLLRALAAAGLVGPVLAACGGGEKKEAGIQQPPQTTALPQTGAQAAAAAPTPYNIGKLVVRSEPYPKYQGTPTDSDLLTIIKAGDLSDINPTAINDYSIFTFVYDPLLWIDEYTDDPKPWLAESWEVSADGKSYTYKLRKDVKWHDGTPLTADDVAFSMITYRDDPDSAVARFFPLMKKDPVVVDANTIRFDLDDTSGDWLLNASNQFIIQKKQFIDYWNAAKGAGGKKTLKGYPYTDKMLIGTGAWKQVKYEPAAAPANIQYERNESYWVEKPHFKRFIYQVVEKPEAQITAWLSGGTDILWPVTATQVDQVKNQDALLYNAYAVAYNNAWFNFNNPKQDHPGFINDKRVRQALSIGIDRKGYAQSIFKGFIDETAVGPLPLAWAYNTNLKSPGYEQAKAQQMLADAGYKQDSSGKLVAPDGKPIKLSALVRTSNTYPVDKIAVSVQEDFRKLGLDMQIETLEPATVRKRLKESYDWDLYFVSAILFAGFTDYSALHSAWDPRTNPQGTNWGGWKNADADKLLDQIIREPDLKKQKDLLWKLQEILADDLPRLWFGFPRDLILVQKNIQGYQPNIMWQIWDLWKLWRTG